MAFPDKYFEPPCISVEEVQQQGIPVAELLLNTGEFLKSMGGLIIFESSNDKSKDDAALARLTLCIEFRKRPIAFQFRAMVENWSQQDIVREMY